MSSRLPNGAKYAISTALATLVPITAASNANPVSLSAGVLPAPNDIVLIQSGWSGLNGRAGKVGTAAAGAFTLPGIDTTVVADYPEDEGVGGYQIASTFVGLTKVAQFTKEGGEQNSTTRQYLDDPNSTQVSFPTYKSAIQYNIELDYDPALPWHAALLNASNKRAPVVLRQTLPGGDVIVMAGLISFDDIPSQEINEVMAVNAVFYLSAPPVRIPAAA